jgi:5-methylthioadenosine/S-adenosylhomocysteine deaminase
VEEIMNCGEPFSRRIFLGGSLIMLAAGKKKVPGSTGSYRNWKESKKKSGSAQTRKPAGIPSSDILIKNGFIATMDAGRTVYRPGSIYITDGRIAEIGHKVDAPSNPAHVIDAERKLVMPGFVNTHAHLQQYFRGVYELIGEFYQVNLPLEMYRSEEDMEQLGAASCAEFIYGGCTTALVIYTYPHGFAKAVEAAGNRAILAADIEEVDLNRLKEGIYVYLPEKGKASYQRAEALYRQWHGKAYGRLSTCICPKAADMVRPETYRRCKEFAEKHDLRITTHLSQSWREVEQVRKLYGKTPPQFLEDLGMMNSRLTGVHCDYITEEDLRLIVSSGMGILHCRSVTNPLLRWLDMGIAVGLGTDDYHHDMLPLLRDNISGQQTRARAVGGWEGRMAGSRLTRRPSCYELLELATRRGAEVLGLDSELGSLEPGKRADVITVDLNNPYLTPSREPLTSFVLYGTSRDIDNVIVDGRLLKQDGILTTMDLEQALSSAQQKCSEIIDRFFHDHPAKRKQWEAVRP